MMLINLLSGVFLIADPFVSVLPEVETAKTGSIKLLETILKVVYSAWFVYCAYEIAVLHQIKEGVIKLVAGTLFVSLLAFLFGLL